MVCEFVSKLRAFLVKLRFWRVNIQAGMIAKFATVLEVLELGSTSSENFRDLACEHLGKLEVELKGYFPDFKEEDLHFLCNPFLASPKELPAGNGMQEDLIDLQHDEIAWEAYRKKTV